MEDEVAKCLHQLELNNDKLKPFLSQIFINSAEIFEYEHSNGSLDKCLFVKIPFRSLHAYHKVSEDVIKHLGKTYNWPVLVSATRTILSKRGKQFSIQGNLFLWYSQETQNPENPKKQMPYFRSRSYSRRYRKFYYNHAGVY